MRIIKKAIFLLLTILLIYPTLPKSLRSAKVNNSYKLLSKLFFIPESNLFTSFKSQKHVLTDVFFYIEGEGEKEVILKKERISVLGIAKYNTLLYPLLLLGKGYPIYEKKEYINLADLRENSDFKDFIKTRLRSLEFYPTVNENHTQVKQIKKICHTLNNKDFNLYAHVTFQEIKTNTIVKRNVLYARQKCSESLEN